MKIFRFIAIACTLLAAPARADYLVLDGNRNPQTFKSLGTGIFS